MIPSRRMDSRKPCLAHRRGLPALLAIGLGLALALAPLRSVSSQDSPETPATKARSTDAADRITIGRPDPGQISHVQSAPRSTYILDFDPNAAQVSIVGSDLSLTFVSNPIERFIISPFNFNYHFEHHYFMTVPYYHAPKLREALREHGELARAQIIPSYTGRLIQLVRQLRSAEPNR